MALLLFKRWSHDNDQRYSSVSINTDHVMAVQESEDRVTGGFFRKIAVVRLRDGTTISVLDENRDAAVRLCSPESPGT